MLLVFRSSRVLVSFWWYLVMSMVLSRTMEKF